MYYTPNYMGLLLSMVLNTRCTAVNMSGMADSLAAESHGDSTPPGLDFSCWLVPGTSLAWRARTRLSNFMPSGQSHSKVFVENGQVKTVLNKVIQQNGYMTVEDAKRLTIEKIKKIYQQNNDV